MPNRAKKQRLTSMMKKTASAVLSSIGDNSSSSMTGRVIKRLARAASSSISPSREPIDTLPSTVGAYPMSSSFKFAPANFRGVTGLSIKGTMPIFDMWGNFGYSVDETILVDRSGSQSVGSYIYPANPKWLGNFLQLVGSAFSRFRFKKLCFHYRPTAIGTNNGVSGMFAYVSDPDHPLINIGSPTTADILDAGGFEFAIWQAWDYEVRDIGDDMLYSYHNIGDAVVDSRLSSAGFIQALSNSSFTATNAYGLLFMSYELELFDPKPIATSVSITTHRPVARVAREEKKLPSEVPPGTVYVVTDPAGNLQQYFKLPGQSDESGALQVDPPSPALASQSGSHIPDDTTNVVPREIFSLGGTVRSPAAPASSQREASNLSVRRSGRADF